jgi:hypothetical protein
MPQCIIELQLLHRCTLLLPLLQQQLSCSSSYCNRGSALCTALYYGTPQPLLQMQPQQQRFTLAAGTAQLERPFLDDRKDRTTGKIEEAIRGWWPGRAAGQLATVTGLHAAVSTWAVWRSGFRPLVSGIMHLVLDMVTIAATASSSSHRGVPPGQQSLIVGHGISAVPLYRSATYNPLPMNST